MGHYFHSEIEHRHAGLTHSMPFLAAAAIIRFTSASLMAGGVCGW
jgi:hypothetical protein